MLTAALLMTSSHSSGQRTIGSIGSAESWPRRGSTNASHSSAKSAGTEEEGVGGTSTAGAAFDVKTEGGGDDDDDDDDGANQDDDDDDSVFTVGAAALSAAASANDAVAAAIAAMNSTTEAAGVAAAPRFDASNGFASSSLHLDMLAASRAARKPSAMARVGGKQKQVSWPELVKETTKAPLSSDDAWIKAEFPKDVRK